MDEQIDSLLIEHIAKPIAFFDSEGILVRANRSWEMLCCEPVDALIILTYEDLVEQLHLHAFDEMQMQDNCKITLGRKTLIIIRHRILFDKSSGIMVEIEDITTVEQNKNMIDATAADIMLDIRTRVASVQNALTLLVEYPDAAFSSDTNTLLNATRREMWDLSRHIETGRDLMIFNSGVLVQQVRPGSFNLKDLLDLIRIECSPVLPPSEGNSALQFDVEGDLQIYSDWYICHFVIANVAFNAFIYSDSTAPVIIRIRKPDVTSFHISVIDKGWGIPHEEQINVFSYGFRGKKTGTSDIAGLGVGLYLARKMLSLINSEIWFTSKPGSGSQFEILLREFQPHE